MKLENIIQLFMLDRKKKYTLEDLTLFNRLANQISQLSTQEKSNLVKIVETSFDSAIHTFEDTSGLDLLNYFKHLHDHSELKKAETLLKDRFSNEQKLKDIDNIKAELQDNYIFFNNMVYENLFFELSQMYADVLRMWKEERDIEKRLSNIDKRLQFYKSLESKILSNLNHEKQLKQSLTVISKKINSAVAEEKFNQFTEKINILAQHIQSALLEPISNNEIIATLLSKMSSDKGLHNQQFDSNVLLLLVQNQKNKKKTISLKASDTDFETLCSLLYPCEQCPDNQNICNYYKEYILNYLNELLEYNKNSHICRLHIDKLANLFDRIEFSNFLYNLLQKEIDNSKIDIPFIKNFQQLVKDLEQFQYSSDEIQQISKEYERHNGISIKKI